MSLLHFDPTDFKRDALVLDCPEMTVSRAGPPSNTYTGAGTIRQTPNGTLAFSLYDATHLMTHQDFFALSVPVGTCIPRTEFYDLRAIDFHGRVWTAEGVEPDTSGRTFEPGVVVRGGLREIECTAQEEHSECGLYGYVPEAFDMPINDGTQTITMYAGKEATAFARNIWLVETRVGQLMLRKEAAGLEAEFGGCSNTLPVDFATRLEETLTLVLGAPVRFTFMASWEDGHAWLTLRSKRTSGSSPRVGSPIEHNQADAFPDCGALLDRYLGYLLDTGESGKRHPLGTSVLKVLRASAGTIDGEALALSVEVEGVARRYFSGYGLQSQDTCDAVDSALRHLEDWPGPSEVLDRIRGSVGQIKGVSARTALRHLAHAGVIAQGHFESWEKLRHPAAHGSADYDSVPELVMLCDQVHQMFLLLIFEVVGYKGRYTDHTTTGWPLRVVGGRT